jgi:hypothetical protein
LLKSEDFITDMNAERRSGFRSREIEARGHQLQQTREVPLWKFGTIISYPISRSAVDNNIIAIHFERLLTNDFVENEYWRSTPIEFATVAQRTRP